MSSFIIFCTFLVLLQIFKRTRNKAFSGPRNTFLGCVSAKPYQNVWARTYGYFYGRLWFFRHSFLLTQCNFFFPVPLWLVLNPLASFSRHLDFSMSRSLLCRYLDTSLIIFFHLCLWSCLVQYTFLCHCPCIGYLAISFLCVTLL
jgi:hypothetical protein